MMGQPFDLLVLVPSLRISGGVQEVLLLAERLMQSGVRVQFVSLWRTENELPHRGLSVKYLSQFKANKMYAFLQYPTLLFRFMQFLRQRAFVRRPSLMVTHFSTFPFAWLAPSLRWFCFNQDIEWMFVPGGLPRSLLRWLILITSRRSNVVTTNSFIESQFEREGVFSMAQIFIWADESWLSQEEYESRPVDVVLLLRRGSMKRLDLYLELLSKLKKRRDICCATVTPDADIHALVRNRVDFALQRPTNQALRDLYKRSKIFVSLSDTEGFGLTPLEAMGHGCVAICRDSGGVRCYMTGSMLPNLIPKSAPLDSVLARIEALLANPQELAANSTAAREIFRTGLHEAVERKKAAIQSLVKSIQLDT
jgi:glycosyltransferase involved in cell wall biosynthesis